MSGLIEMFTRVFKGDLTVTTEQLLDVYQNTGPEERLKALEFLIGYVTASIEHSRRRQYIPAPEPVEPTPIKKRGRPKKVDKN